MVGNLFARLMATAAVEILMRHSLRSRLELCAGRRVRNAYFLLVHVGRYVREQRRAEVTLAGVGKHAENVCSLLGLGRDLESAGKGRARGNADKNAFLGRKILAATNGLRTRDRQDAVDHLHRNRIVSELGDEVGGPA